MAKGGRGRERDKATPRLKRRALKKCPFLLSSPDSFDNIKKGKSANSKCHLLAFLASVFV
jgi:hypothetical protein